MKNIIWIFSINFDGQGPFGYNASLNVIGNAFQEQLKAALLPDITINFITYDANSDVIPVSDLIVFNDVDARYLKDQITDTGLCIPNKAIYAKEIEEIKQSILTRLV
ncbi:hypothetical protein [Pseudolactococcus paracarnosus]|uniref:Uncharacterized protein n=1 Tax=Pseudolactococcus paracarnosus TaxID=2749962 RepID=A0A7L4WG96_9LACT|nr:hypothetical protein [Lactococcus paracarnosus]SPC35456.1 conserved hypothetical protein [Lactococcus piscium]MCJ1977060.1 hypothetical protein [Lactococcus paracarnosus]MCJ1983096.1 hypothetical protein [Lactococcus paracarnosus]MCJ1993988.1 hypothetical protein [Lactococcus paracarnosus]MCJ1997193.1 hypothetical protein [Lactococcus paracarnosus]